MTRTYTQQFERRRPPTNWLEALWQIACALVRIVLLGGARRRS